ncbi:MAG: DUF3794 domain-containing protein [Oscillospiraceae bacterium]|nr:DUF3794 domain-containing protein [Oscillospiraceae bacterium]
MEQGFERTGIAYLDTVLEEVQNTEQTQEIRIPDGMPDVGKILCAWGQVILRGKEWREGSVSCSGGLMVWVLYAPEDGSRERCLESWIPFQLRWDIPEGIPEGKIHLGLLTRFVDARAISPRKLMVRAGIAGRVQVLCPGEAELYRRAEVPGMQLLHSTYPLRLNREAGEKTFELEESLAVPDSVPVPEELVYYRMEPKVTEKKILSDKLMFRGKGELHLLYRSEEGQLHSWDFEIPFSQLAPLEKEHGPEAQAELSLVNVELGLDLDDEGRMRLKGAMAGQYVISDRILVEMTEDAYLPGKRLRLEKREVELPVILQQRRENIYAEQTLSADANLVVDTCFLPDHPRQRRMEDGVDMEIPGGLQVLYYGPDGALGSVSGKWTGQHRMGADGESSLAPLPLTAQAHTLTGNGQLIVKLELPLEITASARQRLEMVTDIEPGETVAPDPNRPTLILRRAGEERLWDLAKGSGTTVEAIRRINRLAGEPEPGQLLLIPVP